MTDCGQSHFKFKLINIFFNITKLSISKMSDDKTQKVYVPSKADSASKNNNNTSLPKYSELGKIVERNMPSPSGTKNDGTTNSIGPKKPSS